MGEQRTYLRNYWYAAAMSAEVGRSLLHRKICDENIVLYRTEAGEPVALPDYCPHRKLPLSRGRLIGDEIECGYHGLRFNTEGRCTFIPAQDQIPTVGLNASPYPLVERYGLVHVWIGDAALADESLIPHFSQKEDGAWLGVEGHSHIHANYLLVLDNLNDLSHLAYVHAATFGGNNLNETPLEMVMKDEIVSTRRWMPSTPQSGFVLKTKRFNHDEPVDRAQTSDFMLPSIMLVSLFAGERDQGEPPLHHIVFNNVTPETEKSCHYFWSVYRCDALDREDVSRHFHDLTVAAFLEDKLTIEAQQKAIDEDTSGKPLQAVAADKAALAVRRLISRKLRKEQSAAPVEKALALAT